MPTRPSQRTAEQSRRWQTRRLKVGARIRELRLSQDLSQEALALESGLSRNMIIGIEWGRKSVAYERLWDVADVLGVSITACSLRLSLFRQTNHTEAAGEQWDKAPLTRVPGSVCSSGNRGLTTHVLAVFGNGTGWSHGD